MERKQQQSLNEAIRRVVLSEAKLAGTQKQVDALVTKNMKMIDNAKKKLTKKYAKNFKQLGLDFQQSMTLGWKKRNPKIDRDTKKMIKDGHLVISQKEVEDESGWLFSCYADKHEIGTNFEAPSGMSGNEEGDLKYEIKRWVEDLEIENTVGR